MIIQRILKFVMSAVVLIMMSQSPWTSTQITVHSSSWQELEFTYQPQVNWRQKHSSPPTQAAAEQPWSIPRAAAAGWVRRVTWHMPHGDSAEQHCLYSQRESPRGKGEINRSHLKYVPTYHSSLWKKPAQNVPGSCWGETRIQWLLFESMANIKDR